MTLLAGTAAYVVDRSSGAISTFAMTARFGQVKPTMTEEVQLSNVYKQSCLKPWGCCSFAF